MAKQTLGAPLEGRHLKPCPLCGHEAQAFDDGVFYPMVKCSSCMTIMYANPEESVDEMCHRWNLRFGEAWPSMMYTCIMRLMNTPDDPKVKEEAQRLLLNCKHYGRKYD